MAPCRAAALLTFRAVLPEAGCRLPLLCFQSGSRDSADLTVCDLVFICLNTELFLNATQEHGQGILFSYEDNTDEFVEIEVIKWSEFKVIFRYLP